MNNSVTLPHNPEKLSISSSFYDYMVSSLFDVNNQRYDFSIKGKGEH